MKFRSFLSGLIGIMLTSWMAQSQEILTPQKLFDLKSVAEVAVSPEKTHIAYTVIVPRPFTDEPGSDYRELYVYDLKTNESIPFITGNKVVRDLGWTPDGSAVTFRASFPEIPGVQVYAISLRGGESYPLTQHTSSIRAYAFIDEQTLAVTALSDPDPLQHETRKKGLEIEVYEEEFRHINLYRYNLNNHKTQQLTKDVTVFDFSLSPDKTTAAAAIAPRNLVDDFYMFKRIHLVNMETGQTDLLLENPGKLGKMAWSPDGTKLAFQSASMLQDAVLGSLFILDLNNRKSFSELYNYVEDMELSITDLAWRDNKTVMYASQEGVDVSLSEQRLDRPSRNLIIEPGKVVFNKFHFIDGLVAFAANTPQHPSELFKIQLDEQGNKDSIAETQTKKTSAKPDEIMVEPERLTQLNPDLENIKLANQRKVTYKARDEKIIEGVLLYPLNYEEDKQFPLITYIHGGPEAAVSNGWSTGYNRWGQIAAARDFFVFMPNYRASSGRGVDFTMAGFGDLAGVEYDDVIDGIDHLIDTGYVDRNRVGIGGGSYGGYFSAWSATKHTDRFAAAVMFVGISNQLSKRNTTDIPWEDYYVHWGYWTHENWEDVYDRSPVKYAPESETPLLILHGTEDSRVHPSQSLEMYRALKLHGNAPVRLIWYEGEGHGNTKNVHKFDYLVRTLNWFEYYLQSDNPKDEMPDKYIDYNRFR